MKLHRFTASTNQKAIAMIHEALGPDALIYSTRSVPNGIEIVAGLPTQFDEHYESEASSLHFLPNNKPTDINLFEKLNTQLQVIKDSMQHLTNRVDKKLHDDFTMVDDEETIKRNMLNYHLNKWGFRGKFSQQYINQYFKLRDPSEPVEISDIETDLLNAIQTTDIDIIDGKHICALIGPTGIGKTTTILKLAKRYLSKYSADTLGIITTDYHDISGKNLLLHYQNLYNIDLEYADSIDELALVLKSMKNKNLVLIDTNGSSQRDTKNVTKLVELMESQGSKISPYIVLPGNVQEPVLDEIARAFRTSNLSGCIITKQDECINIASALSVAMYYKMKIAYVCNGQDINTDIECANKEKILYQVLGKNHQFENIHDNLSEVRYE